MKTLLIGLLLSQMWPAQGIKTRCGDGTYQIGWERNAPVCAQLQGADVQGAVPVATTADEAAHATTADTANHATTAGASTSASTATLSQKLSIDPTDCASGQAPTGINDGGTATGCTVYSQPGHTHVATTDLTATGVKDATTFLRGDDTWAVPAGGSGAPTNAQYWVGAAHASLSAEHDLSGFTGLVKNTTGTPSAAVAGDLPGGPYEPAATLSGIGACGAGTYVHTLNDGATPTCSTPPGTYVLPDAEAATKGGLQLAGDLGGTAALPAVVDDSHAHTTTTVSALDASDMTTGVLAGARGGVGVALPTCSGTDKLTANGTQVSCAADQTSAGGAPKSFFAGKSSASLTADISCSPAGTDICAAASAVNQIPLPYNGTLKNLYFRMQTAPAAGGNTCKILVRYGACSAGTLADSALTCTVVGNGSLVNCSDTSNTVSVTAGNCVQLFYDETGTCAGQIMWSFEFTPT